MFGKPEVDGVGLTCGDEYVADADFVYDGFPQVGGILSGMAETHGKFIPPAGGKLEASAEFSFLDLISSRNDCPVHRLAA